MQSVDEIFATGWRSLNLSEALQNTIKGAAEELDKLRRQKSSLEQLKQYYRSNPTIPGASQQVDKIDAFLKSDGNLGKRLAELTAQYANKYQFYKCYRVGSCFQESNLRARFRCGGNYRRF